MKYFVVATLLYCICFSNLRAQETSISGTITTENDEPMLGASVILAKTTIGAVADENGRYIIENVPAGNYTLIASSIGFGAQRKSVVVDSGQNYTVDFVLNEQVEALNEVVLQGKTKATVLREKAYAVEVVEMKEFKNLATNGNDILAKISGINIRQSGGVGSDFTLSLNGLSGNQVRMFLDGIPMDYFGSSLTLNNFSANLLERIEVYKGVVPIHLSSDALGGAINIVTDQSTNSFLDASYATGSFGTHIASLNAHYRSKKSGFTAKLTSFYNYSDNNYEVPIRLINFDEFGNGTQDDFYTDVEHFHDAYESKMFWAQTGFTKTTFADQLLIGAMYSDNYDEVQQPVFAAGEPAVPYGEVLEEEQKLITNLSYRKSGLFNNKLNLDTYLVAVFAENTTRDISDYQYDWFGNRRLRNNPVEGEIETRKTLLILDTDNYLGRFNAEYNLNDNNNIAFNYSLNDLTVQGTDEYKEENNTQFRFPSDVTKQVMAFSYTNSSYEEKFKNTVFGKYYEYRITSLETNFSGDEILPFKSNRDYLGYGFSSTFAIEKLQLKASYERATRFPEFFELFGDGLNIESNPALLPEESNNYNLGFIYRPQLFNNPFILSVNGYIRDSENFIIPIAIGLKTRYENYVSVTARGIDLSANYIIDNKLFFVLNGTFLDKRDNDVIINGEKARVPNEPYLFGNLSATYRKPELFKTNDNFAATITQNFTHEFPYRWEDIGDADLGKAIVPEQWTTNMELVYSLDNEKYNFSLGVINIWDREVFDNFQQLRPGRTFNFKLRYFIN
ncbi:MAG: TonB-dependent receptor [Bacteroidota bacterium]